MIENNVNIGLPPAQGLYDPRNERDACGIGFVANVKGKRSHEVIVKGIQVLINLTHRGATGCDPLTGDGAGVLAPPGSAADQPEANRSFFSANHTFEIRKAEEAPPPLQQN